MAEPVLTSNGTRSLTPDQLRKRAEELLFIRDIDATEQALRWQLAACLDLQKTLHRSIRMSSADENREWHGRIPVSEYQSELAKAAEDEEDIRQALLAILGEERRTLTAAENAFLDRYGSHVYAWVPEPAKIPTLMEPGPEKVEVMERRLEHGKHLYHQRDTEQAPHERCEYSPFTPTKNFRTLGRSLRLPFEPHGEHNGEHGH